jgi:hypothetical protein
MPIRTITLTRKDGRGVISVLRETALPSRLEHVDSLEHLERHGPGEPTVRLSLTDDVFLRSSTGSCWRLGIPLPVEP